MPIEILPFGVQCNLRCQYCYQNPIRDAGGPQVEYDLDRILEELERSDLPVMLFGGEPLLLPLEELERLWAVAFDRHGGSSLQTNGLLITDAHIEAFRRYRVIVGLSIDGPGELNDARWAGSLEETRKATSKLEELLERLISAEVPPRLIVTLHRGNATPERLPRLCSWLQELDALGVPFVRLHLLEVEDEEIRSRYALNAEEHGLALDALEGLQSEMVSMELDLFEDMRRMLKGEDERVSCIWTGCDPYTTDAVQGLRGDGQWSNCSRTNKEGIDFVKSAAPGFERYVSLYRTDQSDGGCSGCRFFLACKGTCPGTAMESDWRNRTEHCETLKLLFARFERELSIAGEVPVSQHPRRKRMEEHAIGAWSAGHRVHLSQLLSESPGSPEVRPPSITESAPRVAWVSETARDSWAPRLRAVQVRLESLEWWSVAAGLRRCAVITVLPEWLDSARRELGSYGLDLVPLAEAGDAQYGAGRRPDLEELARAWAEFDEERMGVLLGSPPCCRSASAGSASELDDPVWRWAMAGTAADPDHRVRNTESPALLNPILRPLGIWGTLHAPCHPTCSPSLEQAARLQHLLRESGAARELEWLQQILSWSFEWSALHGIVEVRSPTFKMVSQTEHSSREWIVRQRGTSVPEQVGRGAGFAFQPTGRRTVTDSKSHQLGLDHAASLDSEDAP